MRYIDLGNAPDDGSGDSLRDAFEKTNENFREILELLTLRSAQYGSGGAAPHEFVPRYVSDKAPDARPPMLGAIWVDASTNTVYLATGTQSAEDWRKIAFEGGAT